MKLSVFFQKQWLYLTGRIIKNSAKYSIDEFRNLDIMKIFKRYKKELTSKKLSSDEIRRIRLTNIIAYITIATIVIYVSSYSLLDINLFKPIIIFLLIFLVLLSGVILLNRMEHYFAAKLYLSVIETIFIAIISMIIFGKLPGFQVYLLMAAIIHVFIWSIHEKIYLILFVGLSIGLYLVIEFLPVAFDNIIDLPDKFITLFKDTNIIICYLATAVGVGFYLDFSNAREKQLLKQAQELKKSQHHRDVVYSIIAHDLRSPFNGLMGLSEVLLKHYHEFSDDTRLKMIESAHNSAVTLNGLLENLLDWSKMQSGRLEKNMKTVYLRKLSDEIIDLLGEIISKKNIVVKNEINADAFVMADEHMLSTIFRNLLSNAVKFTADGGQINLNARPVDSRVEVCISDTGMGIPESVIDKIFNTNSKIQTSGTNNEKGSGLGLRICYDFIKVNGGDIWVESEVNKGSKFYFVLKTTL